ncbi:hypothetical protein O7608_01030 [Solwaraspora sp. WMMA2056]|uniref:hypothetical protein n=1 Tax=Solwaraspora sp. WMMA2056 TaxID=3015161 RepID=UPI00259BBF62|nr:hypothetical protein [Solwaraspora sp. WMMA2056]WJK41075.1 hypothetical protein O7608_01030 [Solwaraspora sp. WMMA2056]
MADYDCFPLWLLNRGGTDNVDPRELRLSPQLRSALLAWADAYDATLDRQDPVASGFPDAAAEESFHAHGVELAHQVAAELGARYQVTYIDGRTGNAPRSGDGTSGHTRN